MKHAMLWGVVALAACSGHDNNTSTQTQAEQQAIGCTVIADAWRWQHPKAGGERVVADTPALDPPTAITIGAWVEPGHTGTILAKGSAYALAITGGHAHASIGSASVDGVSVLAGHHGAHLAATYDGHQIQLFVDGKLDGSAPASGPLAHSPEPLRLDGADRAAVFPRALGVAEIAEEVACPPGCTGDEIVCASASENDTAVIGCDDPNDVITDVYAIYGTPDVGTCGAYAPGACSLDVSVLVAQQCVGLNSCQIDVSNGAFGFDPCWGTVKWAGITAACGPVGSTCSGIGGSEGGGGGGGGGGGSDAGIDDGDGGVGGGGGEPDGGMADAGIPDAPPRYDASWPDAPADASQPGGCDPSASPGACPTVETCKPAPIHEVFRGVDTLDGSPAHFTTGTVDLLTYTCDTRGTLGDPTACAFKIAGAYLTKLPQADAYCWSDGESGTLYTRAAVGYQPVPADGTRILLDPDGTPRVVDPAAHYEVTFRRTDGSVDRYTDAAGNPAYRRGVTHFIREDGQYNTGWTDVVTWQSSSLPPWDPHAFGGHQSTSGVGLGALAPALAGFSIFVQNGDDSAQLDVAQVPGVDGVHANGVRVTTSYAVPPIIDTQYVDVASGGFAYSWDANTDEGEYVADTLQSPYTGVWNTVVMADGAAPPNPQVALRGEHPLQVSGDRTWLQTGHLDLRFTTTPDGLPNLVASEGGQEVDVVYDDARRVKTQTTSRDGAQVELVDIGYDGLAGQVDRITTTSGGVTDEVDRVFVPGSDAPSTITETIDGRLVRAAAVQYAVGIDGVPIEVGETDTEELDALGGQRETSTSFAVSSPSAGVVRIDGDDGVHVAVQDYPSGMLQSVQQTTPLASTTTALAYASNSDLAERDTTTLIAGAAAPLLSTFRHSVAPAVASDNLSVSAGTTSFSTGSTRQWDGGKTFSETDVDVDNAMTNVRQLVEPDPFDVREARYTWGPGVGDTASNSCSIDGSYNVACGSQDSEDGVPEGETCAAH